MKTTIKPRKSQHGSPGSGTGFSRSAKARNTAGQAHNRTASVIGETGFAVDTKAPNDPEPVRQADQAQAPWSEWITESHVLGVYSCGIPGPLVLAMGSLHDNEAGSPRAIDAFLGMLESRRPRFSGTFIGMIGKLRPSGHDHPHHSREDHNQLNDLLRSLKQEHTEGVFIDCQTTPALTIPYLSVNANPHSAELARKFPLNAVSGLQQDIPVCFTDCCNSMNFRHLTFVAGQHRSAAAFSNQIAMLWLMLVHCGAMHKDELENFQDYAEMLAIDSPSATRAYRVLARYSSSDPEQFNMKPGFENFDFVEKDALLATDRCGAIVASTDGYLLMPSEEQGEDGFLLVTEENAP